jgi:tetratricopeptide (TPR) repeat protein
LIGHSHEAFKQARFYNVAAVNLHLIRARIYAEMGNSDKAIDEFERCVDLGRQSFPDEMQWYRQYYAQFLAETGEINKAEQMAGNLRTDLEESDKLSSYWYAMGSIELAKNNPGDAISYFQKVPKSKEHFALNFMLARSYLKAGLYEDATKILEQLLLSHSQWRLHWGIRDIKIHYLLGLAYEKLGRNREAIGQYGIFVNIWNDVEYYSAELDDAKKRLVQLKVDP